MATSSSTRSSRPRAVGRSRAARPASGRDARTGAGAGDPRPSPRDDHPTSTALGRGPAPQLAAILDVGLTGDAIGVDLDPDGEISSAKSTCSGEIGAAMVSRTRLFLTMIPPGVLRPLATRSGRTIPIERCAYQLTQLAVRILDRVGETADAAGCDSAAIGVGMWLRSASLEIARELAASFDDAGGGTCKGVDWGWAPWLQIGVTGRRVRPAIGLLLRISGGLNDTDGMHQTGTVIEMNAAPSATFRAAADHSIIADAAESLPELIRVLRVVRNATA